MGDVVVEDLEAAAARARAAQRPPTDPPPTGEEESVTGLAAALGREVYTWTSPFNPSIVVRFRRPRGGTQDLVYRILGPEQSSNTQLVRQYMALASVISLGTDPTDSAYKVAQPNTEAKFRALRDRIGHVGPEDDDVYDEPVNTFVFAYECAMYPEQITAMSEAAGSGLSPDDLKRIAKAAGLVRPKD